MPIHNVMARQMTRCLAAAGAAAALSFLAFVAQAQESDANHRLTLANHRLILKEADPTEQGDGTLSAAAKAAKRGPLPFSGADVAAKAAANLARDKAEKSATPRPLSPAEAAPTGKMLAAPSGPVIVGGLNVPGGLDVSGTPPDPTGAIGPSSFVQLVNGRAGIYNRTTGALMASGSLAQLAGVSASQGGFEAQMIWDSTTNRFYYVMISVVSSADNRLSFGFSKTSSPGNVVTDWCHYQLSFGAAFPDFPKLGDSALFAIIGVNESSGSALVAISKPPAGTACPASNTFEAGEQFPLVDSDNNQVSTPVPANQIDDSATGFVVARNGALPSTKLWFFNVTKAASGAPVFGPARGVTVGAYAIPAAASQPTFPQLLDTSDARNTQAVQAMDTRLNTFSFWTQHTIASGTVSAVRWYEINPVPTTPVVLRSGDIASAGSFLFNAAISPDRRVKSGTSSAYGNNFVIEYNVSGKVSNINPRIVATSSVNGGALSSSLLVKDGVGPYRNFDCADSGSTCRWGDYSAATPDPNSPDASRGVVWGTNQFSGVVNPPPDGDNWRTQIFELEP
jgi:hypothetical protein